MQQKKSIKNILLKAPSKLGALIFTCHLFSSSFCGMARVVPIHFFYYQWKVANLDKTWPKNLGLGLHQKLIGFASFVYCLWKILLLFLFFSLFFSFTFLIFLNYGASPSLKIWRVTCLPASTACDWNYTTKLLLPHKVKTQYVQR